MSNMTDYEGAPEDEQLSIPEDLDPGTLQVVVDLWNSTLGGANAELILAHASTSRPDYTKLEGEELDTAVRELVSTEVDPAVCKLGECAVFRAMQEFGRSLTQIVENNQSS